MANTTIEHGAADWDKVLNEKLVRLDDATQDTGWVTLALLNGFTQMNSDHGTQIRRIGRTTYLKVALGSISVGATAFKIPSNFAVVPIQSIGRTTGGYPFSVTLSPEGEFICESSHFRETQPTDYLRVNLI